MDNNSLFVATYQRGGSPMVKGSGVYLYDADGKEYLDFGSGIAVNALGHGHPAVMETIREQSHKLIHASNLYLNESQIALAKLLIEKSFAERIFFCNSGTEANEAAIKFARKYGRKKSFDKYHILSFTDGFHGRTYGGLTATAQEKFHFGFEPLIPGFHYAEFNNIASTSAMLKQHDFAAIIVEPLQGEGGVNQAQDSFLKFLRTYCDDNGVVLIFDEIQCGMGRTGTLWHYEQHGVIPDLMSIAKPLGGGLPLGAVLCKEETVSAISPGDHGTTFGGNPLACAVGTTVLNLVSQPSFLQNVNTMSEYLKEKLSQLASTNPSIQEVRGKGLLIGVAMKQDPAAIVGACRESGLLLIKAGHNTIRFIPPLIVTRQEIDKALGIFTEVLAKKKDN